MTTHTRKLAQVSFLVLFFLQLATLNAAQTIAPQTEKDDQPPIAGVKEEPTPAPDKRPNQIEQLSRKSRTAGSVDRATKPDAHRNAAATRRGEECAVRYEQRSRRSSWPMPISQPSRLRCRTRRTQQRALRPRRHPRLRRTKVKRRWACSPAGMAITRFCVAPMVTFKLT